MYQKKTNKLCSIKHTANPIVRLNALLILSVFTVYCLKFQGFNPSQQRAISTASLMVSRPNHLPRVCLLQGPPGTGKSHTVLGIINQILKVIVTYY